MEDVAKLTLGQAIREARQSNNLSLIDLSLKIGISPQYLSKIELNVARMCSEKSKFLIGRIEHNLKVKKNSFLNLIPLKQSKNEKTVKYSKIGVLIAQKRTELGMSRRTLFISSGINESIIRDIETGICNNPHHIEALSYTLGVEIPIEIMPERSNLVCISKINLQTLREIKKITGIRYDYELVNDAIKLLFENLKLTVNS